MASASQRPGLHPGGDAHLAHVKALRVAPAGAWASSLRTRVATRRRRRSGEAQRLPPSRLQSVIVPTIDLSNGLCVRGALSKHGEKLLHLGPAVVDSRVPGSGVRGRGSGGRETTASSLAGKEESSRKEDNSGQGKDGPAGAIAQGGNGR